MADTNEFLQVKEAAEYLGVSVNTVRNWGASLKLVEYRHPVNNYRLYKLADLRRMRAMLESPKKTK
jgi:DNA (cytosine-5)-methyltransferase 1